MISYDINNMEISPEQKAEIIRGYQEFRHEAWLMRYIYIIFTREARKL